MSGTNVVIRNQENTITINQNYLQSIKSANLQQVEINGGQSQTVVIDETAIQTVQLPPQIVTLNNQKIEVITQGIQGASGGVQSIYGRTGTVTAQNGDYNFNQLSGAVNLDTQVTDQLKIENGGTGASTADNAIKNIILSATYNAPSDITSSYLMFHETSTDTSGSTTLHDVYNIIKGDLAIDLTGSVGFRRQYRSVNTNYTALSPIAFFAPHDSIIGVNASGGARTITMPLVSSALGKLFIITKTDASANAVTIQGGSGQLINGAATQSL